MQRLHKILALAIIIAAVRAEDPPCPPTCRCSPTRLACSDTPVPNNKLTKDILAKYGHDLEEISWTNSKINSIEIDLFTNHTKLEYIDLSRNEIKRTEHGLFARLTRIKHLNISRNRLDDLPRFTFADLENCEVLDVSHNQLHVIPFQIFGPMIRLQYLDISYNKIATFLDYYFNPNRQLKALFLNNNSLVKITSNALVNLTELETLDLSCNKLYYIHRSLFDNFEHLRELNLSYNQLQNISNDAFRRLLNLKRLDLGGNSIKHLPPDLFHYNENLESLYLDNTEMTVLQNTNFKGLTNIQRLYVRNNSILREIEPYVFQDIPTLTHLDISANALTVLPLSLKMLENLQELRIGNNPWGCDCRMAWFANWAEQRKEIIKSDLSCGLAYPNDMLAILNHTYCKPPHLIRASPLTLNRLQTDALLECKYEGNPAPSLTWITPTRMVFHWNPDPLIPDIFHKHGHAHDQYYHPIENTKSRVRVLENGSLFIGNIHREDSGIYLCYATNPTANVSAEVVLNIDPITMFEIKMYSLLCGGICAAAFLALTLLVQALRHIFNRSVNFLSELCILIFRSNVTSYIKM